MTVPNTICRHDYLISGGADTFPYEFQILSATELRVVAIDADGDETVLAHGADFSLTGVGDVGGGAMVLEDPLPNGTRLVLLRAPAFTQPTDLRRGATLNPPTYELALDRLTMQTQALDERLGRALVAPMGTDVDDLDLALPPPEAGMVLGWNDDGDGLVNVAALGGGEQGEAGEQGDPGVDGATWTSGGGAPSGGSDGDFHLRTDTAQVYKRVSGSWSVILTLVSADWLGNAIYNYKGSVVVVSGTTVSLSQASHGGRMLVFTHASGCTVTCPATLPEGFTCTWKQAAGAGQIAFAAGSGASLEHPDDLSASRAAGAMGTVAVFEGGGTAAVATLAGDLGE